MANDFSTLQNSFDSTVAENMELFDMTRDEAVNATLEEYSSHGIGTQLFVTDGSCATMCERVGKLLRLLDQLCEATANTPAAATAAAAAAAADSGMAPHTDVPDTAAAAGSTPQTAVPDAVAAAGSTPQTAVPDAATAAGSTPQTAVPDAATAAGSTPQTAVPDAAAAAGSVTCASLMGELRWLRQYCDTSLAHRCAVGRQAVYSPLVKWLLSRLPSPLSASTPAAAAVTEAEPAALTEAEADASCVATAVLTVLAALMKGQPDLLDATGARVCVSVLHSSSLLLSYPTTENGAAAAAVRSGDSAAATAVLSGDSATTAAVVDSAAAGDSGGANAQFGSVSATAAALSWLVSVTERHEHNRQLLTAAGVLQLLCRLLAPLLLLPQPASSSSSSSSISPSTTAAATSSVDEQQQQPMLLSQSPSTPASSATPPMAMVPVVLLELVQRTELVQLVCAAAVNFTLDDDVRVEFGQAHNNAKCVVEAGALSTLTTVLVSGQEMDGDAVESIMHLCAKLCVTKDNCDQVAANGGVSALLQLWQQHSTHKGVCRRCLSLLAALTGSDQVKQQIVDSPSGASLIVQTLDRLQYSGALCCVGVRLVSCLTLRSPENSRALVGAGIVPLLATLMRRHSSDASLQKLACMSVRNMLSRCEEMAPAFAEAGFERLMNTALKNHNQQLEFEAKQALCGLGCEVQLSELWTGRGGALTTGLISEPEHVDH